METEALAGKIHRLQPEQIVALERFIDFLVAESERKTRAASIRDYVERHAGTDADLDLELEKAAVEFMLQDDAQ